MIGEAQDLIIDLFAGGGGTSEGIRAALGRDPDLAVNHDAEAIALHKANHPGTMHLCEDIRKVDIGDALANFPGRRVGILWASPDCKHHSKAAGGRPKDKNIRGLAWEVLRWAAAINRSTGHVPRMIALENVEEFREWCPLHRYGDKAGKVQKSRKGETFHAWTANLRSLGFTRIEWRELVAADYGVPTTRKRLFLVAMSEDYSAAWPEPTHAPRAKVEACGLGLDGSRLKPHRSAASIIDWSLPIPSIFGRRKELKPKTLARIAKGICRYVIKSPRPFIVSPAHSTTTGRAPNVWSVDEPLRTVTSSNDKCLASAFLKPRYGERAGQEPRALDIEAPAPTTVPSGNGGDLVGVFLGRQFGTTVSGCDIEEPHPTVMSDGGGGKSQVVAAYMSQHNFDCVGREMDQPLTTVMSGGAHQKIVAPIIDKYFGTGVAANPSDPLDTVTTKDRFGLGAAYMEQAAAKGSIGRSLEDPVSTIMGKGCQQRLIELQLGRIEAEEGPKRRAVLELLWAHFGEPTEDEWQDPLATERGRLRFGLVLAAGSVFRIVDIGMRMLVPRELYSAQGFRDDYLIEIQFNGKALTKTAQTRMAGNSVCPKLAAVVLGAFMPPSMRLQVAA
ncbi:MAG: DNA cytosine methyltransferase [Planctomycetes bacterium]|nr:DNA cytosine methyltransferase [Planctomycetota bacterium]